MKQIKVDLLPNCCGYYGVSYFDENKKFHHFVMESLDNVYFWIGDYTNWLAERTFKGSKFEIWSY